MRRRSSRASDTLLVFPKRCGCGRSWLRDAWMGLEYVGVMDDGVDCIELRHCVCGSTISMHVSVVAKAASSTR